MWLIVNENGIKYTISHQNDRVDVLAQSNIGSVVAQGRTRKEAVAKAHRQLKRMEESLLK